MPGYEAIRIYSMYNHKMSTPAIVDWGPGKVSCIERCLYFRVNLHQGNIFGTQRGVLTFSGVYIL